MTHYHINGIHSCQEMSAYISLENHVKYVALALYIHKWYMIFPTKCEKVSINLNAQIHQLLSLQDLQKERDRAEECSCFFRKKG